MHRSVELRIESRITRAGENTCTTWRGSRNNSGQPRIKVDGKLRYSSNIVWGQEHGPIPLGLVVRHTCDNPECLNLNHLILGTHQDNYLDRIPHSLVKVDKEMQQQIRLLHKQGYTYQEIGRKLNIGQTRAQRYATGKDLT
jgi:hypothetical protein